MDAKIVKLQEKISKMKKEILSAKVEWKAGASFELHGKKYNIHLCQNMNQLRELTAALAAYEASMIKADEILENFLEPIKLKGYYMGNWYEDVKTKKNQIENKDKLAKIEQYEKQLESKLSEEFKDNKLFDEIGDFLND